MSEIEISKHIDDTPNNEDTFIPCRVSKDGDSWSDNTEPVKAAPYEHVEGYPHNRVVR